VKKISLQNKIGQSAANGFTLIEVLVGIAIFSVGILAGALMQIRATSSTTTAGNVSANVAVTVDRIEKLMALGYDDADLAIGTVTPSQDDDLIDNDGDGEIDETGETGHITASWDVSETVPKAGSDLYNYKTITVRINRDGPSGSFLTLQRSIPNIVGGS
jgi:prepilin-type N-terminal cleavage/methylation domain-containing protein